MAASHLLVCAVTTVILAVVSGQLAGGIRNANLSKDDEPVIFAVDAINLKFSALAAATNDTYTPGQLVAIINAQQQVVSGMNYILTLLVAAGPQEYVCKATVWSRVWLTGQERLNITNGPECAPATTTIINNPDPTTTTTTTTTTQPPPLVQGALKALESAVNKLNDGVRRFGAFSYRLDDLANVKVTQKVTSSKTFFYFWNLQLEKYECSPLSRFLAIMSRDYNCPLGKPTVLTCFMEVSRQLVWFFPVYEVVYLSC